MEIIVVPVAIVAALMPPVLSGMFAKSLGRSYWKWFFIGCILPFISNIILFSIGKPSEKKLMITGNFQIT